MQFISNSKCIRRSGHQLVQFLLIACKSIGVFMLSLYKFLHVFLFQKFEQTNHIITEVVSEIKKTRRIGTESGAIILV